MVERDESHSLPDWAKRERGGDLLWINENVHILWPAAQVGYETVGRGTIFVDTTSRPTGEGHPFGYLDQAAVEHFGDEETQRLVKEYEPREEFVTTLFKPDARQSSYRLRVISTAESREPLGDRGEAEPSAETNSETSLNPPDLGR